jgi:type II secretory pathway pseudopilin PulG
MNLNLGDKQIIPIYYGLLESTISTAIIISLAYVLVGSFLSAMRGSSKANSG